MAHVGTIVGLGCINNRPFFPDNIPNLSLWLDASDAATITESSNDVSQWDDKSGNGYDVSQGTGSLQPTWTDASSGVIFDGNKRLSVSGFPQFTDIEIFAVTERKGVLTNPASIAYCSNEFWMRIENSVHYLNFYTHDGTGYTSSTTGSAIPVDTKFVANAWYDESERHVDDNMGNSDTDAVTYTLNSATTSFDIGAASVHITDHIIYELLIYSQKLSTAERAVVTSYLNGKWGV